jgi:hypothetical protein
MGGQGNTQKEGEKPVPKIIAGIPQGMPQGITQGMPSGMFMSLNGNGGMMVTPEMIQQMGQSGQLSLPQGQGGPQMGVVGGMGQGMVMGGMGGMGGMGMPPGSIGVVAATP